MEPSRNQTSKPWPPWDSPSLINREKRRSSVDLHPHSSTHHNSLHQIQRNCPHSSRLIASKMTSPEIRASDARHQILNIATCHRRIVNLITLAPAQLLLLLFAFTLLNALQPGKEEQPSFAWAMTSC